MHGREGEFVRCVSVLHRLLVQDGLEWQVLGIADCVSRNYTRSDGCSVVCWGAH